MTASIVLSKKNRGVICVCLPGKKNEKHKRKHLKCLMYTNNQMCVLTKKKYDLIIGEN